jgi:ELWxxDGT repeat protein
MPSFLLRRIAIVALCATIVMAPARVVATVAPDGGPTPSFLKVVGDQVFFALYDAHHGGWALWRTDGSPDGTLLLRADLGLDVELLPAGDRLVFSTRGALWTSDGTPEGTTVVTELPFYPNSIKRIGDDVFFSDGRGQLWRSDLTAPGTTLVKDIPPGFLFHDLTPAALTDLGGFLFFRAVDATHGSELWFSDGTTDGTIPIDINPFAGSAPGYFATTSTRLFCSASDGVYGYELWRSDGTADGTTMVRDINPIGDSWPRNLRVIDDVVFFSADDGTGDELWRSNGTKAGTTRVKDINPSGGSFPNALVEVDHTLYFRADDGTHGLELWRSDGTDEGTTLVRDVNPSGSAVPANLRNVKGRLFFSADDGVHGDELWTTDGTPDGTVMVADLNPHGGSYPHAIVNVGTTLFLAADDGTNGTQLWTVACTDEWVCTPSVLPLPAAPRADYGTPYLVKDTYPGPGDGEPYYMTNVGGKLFFQAFRPDTGIELWTSDGTEAGTRLVRDIEPGPGSSDPYDFTGVGGVAYFVGYTLEHGTELWRSDGTEAGTHIVRDLRSAWDSSYPERLTPFDGKLFFSARDDYGYGLFETDGTEAGTQRVAYVSPYMIATLNDGLYFVSWHPQGYPNAYTVWRSDGTAEGTHALDVFFEAPTGNPRTYSLVRAGAYLYFRAQGGQLWRTDGTVAGTIALTPYDNVNPEDLTAVGDVLYFSGTSYASGRELWRSDGTPAGTHMVTDLNPLAADGMPGRLTNVNGTLFFWATDGKTGFELWKSDGTVPGTVLVRDIDPTDVTVPSYFLAIGDVLYFTAHNPSFGYELWRSDGTADGTAIVRNLNLVRSSYPESPANVNGTLFFYADDGRFGDELWALETPTTTSTTAPATSTVPGATTSTTTTPAPPTTSSTLPREDCGNCVDDDGDGDVDFEDSECCATRGLLALGQVRVKPHDGGSTLKLKGVLGGFELPAAGAADLVLQLRSDKGPSWCARIPASALRAAKRGLRFDDSAATVASANGLERIRLQRAKRGGKTVVISGDDTSFTPAAGHVEVTLALVGAGDGARCVGSSATLRPSRRGGLATGR